LGRRNNSVRAVDVFVEALDLRDLGFEGVDAAGIGRPSYRPGVLLKLYIYGYLNRVQSSRRLESEAGRNLEVMWASFRYMSFVSRRFMRPPRRTMYALKSIAVCD
jgi:transposase